MARGPSAGHDVFEEAVDLFVRTVGEKFAAAAPGEPEEQLRGPLENLFREFARLFGRPLVLKGESLLEGGAGRPDYALHDGRVPIGHIELKAPGKGADTALFASRDKKQWCVFRNLPNILYTDGDSWALYRGGERVGALLRLGVDPVKGGPGKPPKEPCAALFGLLCDFASWEPVIPKRISALASFLAPYCRLLKEGVAGALGNPASPIHRLKAELKDLLFPDASDAQFADAYAQTVLFALLLARMEGADTLSLGDTIERLDNTHLLLSKSLQFLTQKGARAEIETALSMVCRVIAAIEPSSLKSTDEGEDPWLFFYEHFLAAYDPALRRDAGAYYTPLEVVRCQVRLTHEILVRDFGKRAGFLEAGVLTLDPAVGTGTYLLAVISHALAWARDNEGEGAVPASARSLFGTLFGFEWLVGPYAVAQLRLSRAFADRGAVLPTGGANVYLTNTLESPHITLPTPSLFHEPIAYEHKKALRVKSKETIMVTLGNPPYGRHTAAGAANRAATGAWVRYGDADKSLPPILSDFTEPARKAGQGIHLKNLYNLYVYFIRWALWKTFECETAERQGIVTFITASSYLDGDAFVGLRRHMRKICERIDVIDLGGDGRGTLREENIFNIQTPVCIFFAWRRRPKDQASPDTPPALVRYARISGGRQQKLEALDRVFSEKDIDWQTAPSGWNDTFTPEGRGVFFNWPHLRDIMPWQLSGVKCSRTWPIAPSESLLKERWAALCSAKDRAEAFKECRDIQTASVRKSLFGDKRELPTIGSLDASTAHEMEPMVRYAYRSFDRQYLLADARVITRPCPTLWSAHGDKQLYFAYLTTTPIKSGPALTCSSNIPDLDFFRGSFGAKVIFPLYRDADAALPNVSTALLDKLSKHYGLPRKGLAESLAAYVYAVLAHPGYTEAFADELQRKEIRLPLTKDAGLFKEAASFGRALIHLHTHGERFVGADPPPAAPNGRLGRARCTVAVPGAPDGYPERHWWENGTLFVGGGQFAPVAKEVYDFDVSGLKVVQSWLGYRMKKPKGKKSSPLDAITQKTWPRAFTTELLELLWLLEATLGGYPGQRALLEKILAGPLFTEAELPPVADRERKWTEGPDEGTEIQMAEVAPPDKADG